VSVRNVGKVGCLSLVTLGLKHSEVRRLDLLRQTWCLVFTVALNPGSGRDDWAKDLWECNLGTRCGSLGARELRGTLLDGAGIKSDIE